MQGKAALIKPLNRQETAQFPLQSAGQAWASHTEVMENSQACDHNCSS